jgi:heptaprenyl diphosphate synthase
MNNRKLVTMALFITAAMMLSYIESLFPFFFGVPGMKLGLANLAVVMALYLYGWREALMVNVLRILLTGLLFGNMFSVLFSLSGALVSFICMLSARKLGLSLYGVSMAGGVFHNAGQLLTAAFIVQTVEIGYYAPFLLAAGLVTGFLIGVLGKEMLRRIPEG